MLKEALVQLQYLIEKQSAPQKIQEANLHGSSKFIVNGQVIDVAHTPAPRNHEAHDLESLALLVKQYAAPPEQTTGSTNAVVWVGG